MFIIRTNLFSHYWLINRKQYKLVVACITCPQKFYSRLYGSYFLFFFMHIFYYFLHEHCNASTHAYIRPPFILFGAKKITLNDDLTCSLQARQLAKFFKDLLMRNKERGQMQWWWWWWLWWYWAGMLMCAHSNTNLT